MNPGASDPVPCIVCGKVLQSAIPGAINQPYAGTAFMTTGHYGSTAFDPMDGSRLEIIVCDPCLILAIGRVMHFPPQTHRTRQGQIWDSSR